MNKLISLLPLLLLVASCSSDKSPKSSSSSSSSLSSGTVKTKLPSVALRNAPGGMGMEWNYLGVNKDRVSLEINTATIKNIAGVYNVDTRITISEPKNFKYGLDDKYKYSLNKVSINCANEAYKAISATTYTSNGKLIKSYSFNSPFKVIQEQSLIFLAYNYVCLAK